MGIDFKDITALQSAVYAAFILFFVTTIVFIWFTVVYIKKKGFGNPDDSNLYIDCAYFQEVGKHHGSRRRRNGRHGVRRRHLREGGGLR